MTARHPTTGGKGKPATDAPPKSWRGPGEVILTAQMIIDIVRDYPPAERERIIKAITEQRPP